jgi:phytoene dehydrogenase-like protein
VKERIEILVKRPSDDHEVIVLGAGLGGLLAGALLSKNNHSVLLLKERDYQTSCVIKGYRFIPFSNFSEKRLATGLLNKISQVLPLPFVTEPQEKRKQAETLSEKSRSQTTFQVVLPKGRIDIFSQRPLFQKEWKREFPREVAQVETFYKELEQIQTLSQEVKRKKNIPPFFPLQQRSSLKKIFSFDPFPKGILNQRLGPFSEAFKEFIRLQWISKGNLYSDQLSLSAAAHIFFDEAHELNSTIDAEKLGKALFKQFEQFGGKIEEVKGVKKVERGWRGGFTLSLEEEQKEFRSKLLIHNSPLCQLSNVMAERKKEWSKWEEKIKPFYVMIPLFLGVREKVIPVGMKDLLVSIFDLEKPYEDGNVLFLSMSTKGDETQAPEGRRAITVESLMDWGKWDQALLVDYQKGVMKHLTHLFPFLEDHIELMDLQWAIEHLPKWSYSHYFYKTFSDFYWREGVVPTRLSNHLYLVGKENFPYWGLEGELFSGWMAAQQILKKYS